MSYIEEWLEHTQIGEASNNEKEWLIDSELSNEWDTYNDSSLFVDADVSSSEDEEVVFKTYEVNTRDTTGRKASAPLKDSSAMINVDMVRNNQGHSGGDVNKMKSSINDEVLPTQTCGEVDDDVNNRFKYLNMGEDKENAGDVQSLDNFKTARNFNSRNGKTTFEFPDDYENGGDFDCDMHDYDPSINKSCVQSEEQPGIVGEVEREIDGEIVDEEVEYSAQEEEGYEELLLDELPRFNKDHHDVSYESLTVSPDFLQHSDGDIIYFESLQHLDDPTFLPRFFQHHRLRKSMLKNTNEPYEYYKNKNCPPSSDSESSLNYIHHRYSRVAKVKLLKGSLTEEDFDVMCRFCRGQNWVSKPKYNEHLLLSHGIAAINYFTSPNFLRIPKSMFILKSRSFKTFYVCCGICLKWIRLGNSAYDDKQSQPTTQGLYYNYFSHCIQSHSDDCEC